MLVVMSLDQNVTNGVVHNALVLAGPASQLFRVELDQGSADRMALALNTVARRMAEAGPPSKPNEEEFRRRG